MILFFLILGSPLALAQIDLIDALKQTAEMYNEENAQGQESNGEGSAASSEGQNAWHEEWEKKKEENSAILDALDDKNDKCLALMILYLHEYYSLVDLINSEQNCKMKYDLYGMELLTLTSSTTIMYCPEGLDASDNKAEIMKNFIDKFFVFEYDNPENVHLIGGNTGHLERTALAENGNFSVKLADLIANFGRENYDWETEDYGLFMESLISPFRPEFITTRLLTVGAKMEALGCSG